MLVSETMGSRANLQKNFLMEKVLVNLPINGTKDHPTEIIIVYDSGSGRTVGNNIEYLDQSKVQRFTNLILSSLNGIDKSLKRVCEISILQNSLESCSLDIICPRDNIPKPPPQSMSVFKETQCHHRYKEKWISDITEEDLDNLPIILLGLSDIRNFPIPIENRHIDPKLLNHSLICNFTIANSQGKDWLQR